MSGVRIKNLYSASEVIDKFDEFEFVVDSPDPDSTLKLSGKELKRAIERDLPSMGTVSVQGEQVIRHNADGVPDNASITLTATEYGISSTPFDRKWQYKVDTDWGDVVGANGLTFVLTHDAEIWRDRKVLMLRYVACGQYTDTITIVKVFDGRDGLTGTTTASIVFRGEHNPYVVYYNNSLRRDVVRYGDDFYVYRGPNEQSSWWNDRYWEHFGAQFDSIATGLLLSELAYIENLGVKNLRTNPSGQRVEITQNNNALAFYDGVQSYPVVEIKTTSDSMFLGQGSGILVRHPQSDITINNGILQRCSEGSGVSVPVLPWGQAETIAQNCILQSYNNSYTGKYKTGIYIDISASQSTASGTDKFTALFANGGGIFLQGGASAFRSNNVFCGVTCAGRVNSSGTLLNSWVITFMGGYLSSSRFAEGRYRIYFSNTGYFVSGSEYQVLLLPDGLNDQSTGAYGTVSARYTSYFDVWMADDASPNNTGFTFIVFLLSKFW